MTQEISKPPASLPWYLTRRSVVVGLLVLGPLALPLVWMTPRFKVVWKTAVTIATVLGTWALVYYTATVTALLSQRLTELKSMGVLGG